MSGRSAVVYDDGLTRYNFGPGHPMAPIRVDLTMRLARSLGVFDDSRAAARRRPDRHRRRALAGPHRAVHRDGQAAERPSRTRATSRTAWAPRTTRSSRGCTTPPRTSWAPPWRPPGWSGVATSLHAVNVSGGLHHAMADSASGFCIYNDPAIAIAWLLANGAKRVAYVDIDAHHGDGVQKAFYDDPRVLTISLHESPRTLFPGTGYSIEAGGPQAPGSAVNVPLPPGTGDAGWLRAFHAVVPDLLRAFEPRHPGQPARLRLSPGRPAHPSRGQRRRAARGARRPPRPRARGRGRSMAGDRRRRIRRARRGSAHLDPPARGAGRSPAGRGGQRPAGLPAPCRRPLRRPPPAHHDVRRSAGARTTTGRAGTTPTRGWTGASRRPGVRSSRGTGSTSPTDTTVGRWGSEGARN